MPVYHLTPASEYHRQPDDAAYQPASLAEEGFIHCTGGAAMLLEVANAFFVGLTEELLVLEIDPSRLVAPLKFEPPIPRPDRSIRASWRSIRTRIRSSPTFMAR
ncbi:MAG TPA: DUF952 domain-containing protein [Anaerolineae bacterium]